MQKQRVTVIIPNYNHARFLPDRLDSVLNQTYQNLQIILMDDCSTDDSRRILDRYARQDARIQLVYNEQNSGSTFKQWNKGISLASGEYVWIAESDDVAEQTFLERMVDCLVDHPDAGLAYCQSYYIDQWGRRGGRAFGYEDGLGTQDFYLPGSILAKNYMPVTNITPNASAVLMRRSELAQVTLAPEDMKLTGDWVFWTRFMRRTNVCYVAEPLNCFRTHPQSVRIKMLNGGLLEYARVLALMKNEVALEEDVYKKALDILIERWFHSFIYTSWTLRGYRAFMREMQTIEPTFQILFRKRVIARLFRDRLSGFKMLVGDKLLGRGSVPANLAGR